MPQFDFLPGETPALLSVRRSWLTLPGLVGGLALFAAAEGHAQAEAPNWAAIQPMLQQHCYSCHGEKKTKGGVDLKKLSAEPQVGKEFELWQKVRESVQAGDMPPEDEPELATADKEKMLGWLGHSLEEAMKANAGDPGVVTIRRLTNAEYDNTIRDLTGRDYTLSKDFLPDGGGGEGFSNIGDVLFVSPQQLDKYFAAARKLADQATILPGTGIQFTEQRVGTRGFDQLKAQGESSLYVWYQKMAAPYLPKDDEDQREGAYLTACWKWKFKAQTGATSLAELAKADNLSLPFLDNWWAVLNSTEPKSRYLDLTRVNWRELPGPTAEKPKEVSPAVAASINEIAEQRKSWTRRGEAWGNVQRMQQDSDGIRPYPVVAKASKGETVHLVVGDTGDGNRGDVVTFGDLTVARYKQATIPYVDWLRKRLEEDKKALQALLNPPPPTPVATPAPAPAAPAVTKPTVAAAPAPSSSGGPAATAAPAVAASNPVPAKPPGGPTKPPVAKAPTPPKKVYTKEQLTARIAQAEAVLAKFGQATAGAPCGKNEIVLQAPAVFDFPMPEEGGVLRGNGRYWLAGPDADFGTVQWRAYLGDKLPDPQKIMPGVLTVWKRQTQVEREAMRDFNMMKIAFPDEYLRRLEEVARNFQRGGKGVGVYYLSDAQLLALVPETERVRHQQMMEDWKYVRSAKISPPMQAEWDKRLKEHVTNFAGQAWRRPLTDDEKNQLAALYQDARTRELDPESAAREVVVRVLVSPKFLFKLEDAAQPGEHRVSPWDLITRLSYFIWSSQPDAQLRATAADGSIFRPDVLSREVKRMLRDPRAEAMAREFAGQWLEFNGFNKHSTVDTKLFPEFTPELREDLYEETIRFIADLVQEDRPITEMLTADYTFLNERLAKHYGIPGVQGPEFRKVPVGQYHRGGILAMGSILTKTSFPNRTSPVLRGNWLLRSVLGTPTPPPPANVPELSHNQEKPTTLRARLEQHRADKACASCHDKIDPLGFALEGFDPIGRWRTTDEGGLPLDTSAKTKDGATFDGIDGLRKYLLTRQKEFSELLSRKMIGYALGRVVLPTDKPLVQQMATKPGGARFSDLALLLTESRQFQNRRND